MKKKTWLIASPAGCWRSASAQTFWDRRGVQHSTPIGGLPSNAMLSLKLPSIPLLWGIGLQLGRTTSISRLPQTGGCDQQNLVSFINLYVGPGLYLSLADPISSSGGRVPIGLNAYPIRGARALPRNRAHARVLLDRGINEPTGLQGAFGFRFWFSPKTVHSKKRPPRGGLFQSHLLGESNPCCRDENPVS